MWELSGMLEISYNLSGHSYKKASYIKIVSLFILFVRLIVALFTLFTEPRVGKVQAKGLEGDSRSHRNYRQVCSLLAHAAAAAADTLYSLFPRLTQQTQLWHSSKCRCLSRWSSRIPTAYNLWPSEYLMTCMCSAINLCCYIVIIYKTWGRRAWMVHLG